jgi:hypothetical protein
MTRTRKLSRAALAAVVPVTAAVGIALAVDADDEDRESAALRFTQPRAIDNPYLRLTRFKRCIPADPAVGATWRFEDVPGVTTEDNRVMRRLATLRVRGTAYRDLIEIREAIKPENEIEHKLYARGVGVVRESPPGGRVELVDCR